MRYVVVFHNYCDTQRVYTLYHKTKRMVCIRETIISPNAEQTDQYRSRLSWRRFKRKVQKGYTYPFPAWECKEFLPENIYRLNKWLEDKRKYY